MKGVVGGGLVRCRQSVRVLLVALACTVGGTLVCTAEQWVVKQHGFPVPFDRAYVTAVDRFGNVIVAGTVRVPQRSSFYITTKYDAKGSLKWARTYAGPGGNLPVHTANAITTDADGNVYVTGASSGNGTELDFATLKYNPEGFLKWVARYDGPAHRNDVANAIAVDNSGNVYVSGSSIGVGTSEDFATIKYDSLGVEQWIGRYNASGSGKDFATAIKVDSNGHIYVVGASTGLRTGLDYTILKYNPTGQQMWVSRYNGLRDQDDIPYAVTLDNSGHPYVTGTSGGSSGGKDYVTIKYDSLGLRQWLRRYNGIERGDNIARSIVVDLFGNAIVTGTSQVGEGSFGYATVKYDSAGTVLWLKRYNCTDEEPCANDAYGVVVDELQNVYVTGYSSSPRFRGVVTLAYDANGVDRWVERHEGPPVDKEHGNSISVDGTRGVYVTALGRERDGTLTFVTLRYDGVAPLSPFTEIVKGTGPKVFLDCPENCFEDFIRTEVASLSYVRDRNLAEVHLLVTVQPAGNGGSEYRLTFIGLQRFSGMVDTLSFVSAPLDTEDKVRTRLLSIFKLGIARYVARTPLAEHVTIDFPEPSDSPASMEDPWKSWVFSTDVNAELDGEKNRKAVRLSASVSANRITEYAKLRLGVNGNYGESKFTFPEGTILSFARGGAVSGLVAFSLGTHWSLGGFGSASSSTYSNIRLWINIAPAIEYNVFPYSESTRRELRFQYRVGYNRVRYYSETIFDRFSETLYAHSLTIALDLKQPWGSASVGIEGSQYLHDLLKNRLVFNGGISVNIAAGLSLRLFGYVSRIRDQLSLQKMGATPEEVLLQRRELATTYYYSTSIGISYTFGSIYSSVINPRFER